MDFVSSAVLASLVLDFQEPTSTQQIFTFTTNFLLPIVVVLYWVVQTLTIALCVVAVIQRQVSMWRIIENQMKIMRLIS